MKRKFWTSALALIVVLSLCFGTFAACEEIPASPTYYAVTFDLDGGTVEGQDVSKGLQIEKGATLNLADYVPTKEGNRFNGWKSGETVYGQSDTLTVNSDVTLKAQWKRYDQLAEELKSSIAVYLSSDGFESAFLNARTAQAQVPLQYLRYVKGSFYTVEIIEQLQSYLNLIEDIYADGKLLDSLFAGSGIASQGWYGISDYLYTWSLMYNRYLQWCGETGVADTAYTKYIEAISGYVKSIDDWQSNSQKKYSFNGKEITQANLYYEGYNSLNNMSNASRRMTVEQFTELLGLVEQATGNHNGHQAFLTRYSEIADYDSWESAQKNAFKTEVLGLWKACMPVTQVSFGYSITNVLPLISHNLGIKDATPYCDSVMLSYYEVDETSGEFVKAGGTPNWVGFSGRPIAASLYREHSEYSQAYEKTMQGYFPYTDGWNQPLDEMINLDRLCNYYNHDLGTGANVAPEFALLTGMMHGIDMEHYIKEVYTDLDSEVGKEYNIITLWRENLKKDDNGSYRIENTTDMAVAIAYCAMVEGINAPTPFGLYQKDVAVIDLPEITITLSDLAIKTSATKRTFEYGEAFVYDGLVVEKVMSNGDRVELSAEEYSVTSDYDGSTPGTYTVTVTLKEDESKTATYDVTVKAKPNTIESTLVEGNTYAGQKLTFDVFAKDGNGNKIASSVTLNGETVAVNWDDSEKTSFTLVFTQYENIVAITAGTGELAVTKTYHIYYEKAPMTFTFSVDAFSIGCGYLIDPVQVVVDKAFLEAITAYFNYTNCDVETFEEEYLNAAHILVYLLEQYDYVASYTGNPTPGSGFYLSIIENFQHSDNVPDNLRTVLEENGFSIDSDVWDANALGEFDYTYGSGWMYCVNGVFPNVGFSDYYIQDGDVMRVQFTLAYGADIGGTSSLGGGFSGDYFADVNEYRDALTKAMAIARAQGKQETEEYLAAFALIQAFDITAEELEAAQLALESVLD